MPSRAPKNVDCSDMFTAKSDVAVKLGGQEPDEVVCGVICEVEIDVSWSGELLSAYGLAK
jgi:hypothetical protein